MVAELQQNGSFHSPMDDDVEAAPSNEGVDRRLSLISRSTALICGSLRDMHEFPSRLSAGGLRRGFAAFLFQRRGTGRRKEALHSNPDAPTLVGTALSSGGFSRGFHQRSPHQSLSLKGRLVGCAESLMQTWR